MNYIDTVLSYSQQKTSHAEPIPIDIVGHALNLRTSPIASNAFENHADKLHLDILTAEQKHLAQTRIAGSIATRFALLSFYTPDVSPFVDLSDTAQSEVINELMDDYAAHADAPPSLLLDSTADPIADISHKDTRNMVYQSRVSNMSFAEHFEMIRSYANLVPGSFPRNPHTIAPIADNDATFTQAFGRDNITDKELVSIKEEKERLGDDTLMMEYLDSINFQPGPSNDALAEAMHAILTSTHPNEQMVQWEPAFSLWKNHQDTYTRFKEYLHILWPSRGFYPTFEVKADSIKAMDQVGAYNPSESAHGDMMIRALGIINKQGIIADPIEVKVPFDPNSTQPHVRNARSWVIREFLTRGEHLVRGRVKF